MKLVMTFMALCLFLVLSNPVSAESKVKRLYVPISTNATLVKEGSDTNLLVKDYLGSTRTVSSRGSISDQNYLPYGSQIIKPDTRYQIQDLPAGRQVQVIDNSQTDKGFTGHRSLDDSPIIHMAARFYNPQTGTFIQPDTVEGPYRYSYVKNNPVSLNDPTGHCPLCQPIDATRPLSGSTTSWDGYTNPLQGVTEEGMIKTTAIVGVALVAPFGVTYMPSIGSAAIKTAVINGGTAASIEGGSQLLQKKFEPVKLATAFGVGVAVPPLLSKGSQFAGPIVGGISGRTASAIASNPYLPTEVQMMPGYISNSRVGGFLSHFLHESGNALPIVAIGALEDVGKYGLTDAIWTNWVLSKFAVKLNMVAKAGSSLTERLPLSEGLQEKLITNTLPKGFKYGSMYAFRGNPVTKKVYEQYVEPVEHALFSAFSPRTSEHVKTEAWAK